MEHVTIPCKGAAYVDVGIDQLLSKLISILPISKTVAFPQTIVNCITLMSKQNK